MTEAEFRADFDIFINTQFELYRNTLPYKTGNLAMNAYKITKTPTGYKIWIDLAIAPYAEYIDRPNYRTHGYWEKLVINRLMEDIKSKYGGMIA